MRNVIETFFPGNSTFVKKIDVHPSCVPHSSRFGKKCKIRNINGMKSSEWHSATVDGLLNFLVSGRKQFSLVIVFCEDEPSNNNESGFFWDFHFKLCETGFVCTVVESKNGYEFKKDLVLVEDPKQKDYYLVSEKRKDLCVVMDEEQIRLEPRHANSFVTTWEYCGNENDPNSRHRKSQGLLRVFGVKLKSINSDVTKCLGAADPTTVGLMQASIPEHGSLIKTKVDNRFFYHSTVRDCSMFESTQYENHFLAVNNGDKESVSPYLYLKKITTDREYDEEILFKMEDKK